MLEVDVERIEAGGAGDARDLDAADEPHRHRRHHFVARELRFDIVAQDVAYQHGWPSRLPSLLPSRLPSLLPSLGVIEAAALCCAA
jgi:hypothetical protein